MATVDPRDWDGRRGENGGGGAGRRTPFSARLASRRGEPNRRLSADKRPPGLSPYWPGEGKGLRFRSSRVPRHWTFRRVGGAHQGAERVALRPGETELRFTVAEALAKAVELNDRRLEPGETYAVKFAVRGKGELAGKISADVKKLALDLTERPSHALVIRVKPVGLEAELFFVSNHPEVATVDDKGVIRAVAR